MCSFLVRDFGDIVTTDFGGKIEKEANVDIITCITLSTLHIIQ